MANSPETTDQGLYMQEITAANAFRDTMVPKADGQVLHCPIWHGWVIMDAFLAGIKWERFRDKA